jgi:hypothetical protein
MSLEEAALYRRRFFETYPGLKRWHERERRATVPLPPVIRMSVPFNLGSTFYGGQGVSFRGLTTLLGLVKDPEKKRNEKGYKHRPEQHRE